MMDPIMVGLGGDAPLMLGVLWSLSAITLVFVVLRFYTRIKIVQSYGMDDHFFNASFLCLIIYDVMMTIASYYGFGRNMSEILELKGLVDGGKSATKAVLYSAIGQTILVFGTGLSKTSLALFLLRITSRPCDKVAIWIPNMFLWTAIAIALFIFWFSCQPTAYLWDRTLDGKCTMDPGPISIYAGSWSVFLDFWYAAFPWWLLWNLQMPRREKWIITGSMSLGVFAGACGIKRAIELKFLGSPNYTKDVVGIIIWHAAELATTMTCIGVPVCRPLYNNWLTGWTSGRGSDEDPSGGSGWLKKKDESSDGVFGMHTIGGTEFTQNGSRRKETLDHDNDGVSTDDDILLRGDITPSKQRCVTVRGAVSRSHSDNASEESILGARYNGDRTGDASIRVKKEFDIKAEAR